jgi:hypothetical protein
MDYVLKPLIDDIEKAGKPKQYIKRW